MKKGVFFLFLTAFCWSLAGILIRVNHVTGLAIASLTSAFALVASLLIYHQPLVFNKRTIIVGISQCMMSMTFIYANQLTTVANALILQYTSTIFVLIYQSIDLHHLPSKRQLGIISMVIIGMVMFFFDSLSPSSLFGNLLAVISGALFGLDFYFNNKEDGDAFTSCLLAYTLSFIIGAIVLHYLPAMSPIEWVSVASYGLITLALGGIFYSMGIQFTDAFTANLICMLEIFLAPLWAFLLFHETISGLSLIGALIVISGIVLNLLFDFGIIEQS